MTGPRDSRGHVFFSGDDRLEGILEWPETTGGASADGGAPGVGDTAGAVVGSAVREAQARPSGGVVVAHPHPLYGGTMAQPVVYRIAQACREQGLATLRFNFRGVGQSRGRYSGREEYRDVEAAVAFLRGRLAAKDTEAASSGGRAVPVGLAGYSFGSVMAAIAAGKGAVAIQALALVALVVEWDEWKAGMLDGLGRFRAPVLAVCGEADDLAPPASVERILNQLKLEFRVEVVAGAGHLFEQKQRDVGERVAAFFAEELGARRPVRQE